MWESQHQHHQHQSASSSINIKQHQLESIRANQHQSASVNEDIIDNQKENQTTVNWAQLSNAYRVNEQTGDRAEWKCSPSSHQVVCLTPGPNEKWFFNTPICINLPQYTAICINLLQFASIYPCGPILAHLDKVGYQSNC